MSVDEKRLKAAWNQRSIPIALRRTGEGECTRARLPEALLKGADARSWILAGRKDHYLQWNPAERCWEFPKKWFNGFVETCLSEFAAIYIIQPFREHEVCARACMNAKGHECTCSCMGQRHGSGVSGSWLEVSEAFAVRFSVPELACRLLTRKPTGA